MEVVLEQAVAVVQVLLIYTIQPILQHQILLVPMDPYRFQIKLEMEVQVHQEGFDLFTPSVCYYIISLYDIHVLYPVLSSMMYHIFILLRLMY